MRLSLLLVISAMVVGCKARLSDSELLDDKNPYSKLKVTEKELNAEDSRFILNLMQEAAVASANFNAFLYYKTGEAYPQPVGGFNGVNEDGGMATTAIVFKPKVERAGTLLKLVDAPVMKIPTPEGKNGDAFLQVASVSCGPQICKIRSKADTNLEVGKKNIFSHQGLAAFALRPVCGFKVAVEMNRDEFSKILDSKQTTSANITVSVSFGGYDMERDALSKIETAACPKEVFQGICNRFGILDGEYGLVCAMNWKNLVYGGVKTFSSRSFLFYHDRYKVWIIAEPVGKDQYAEAMLGLRETKLNFWPRFKEAAVIYIKGGRLGDGPAIQDYYVKPE